MDKIGEARIDVGTTFEPFDQSFNRMKYFGQIIDSITTDQLPNSWAIKDTSGIINHHGTPNTEQRKLLLEGAKKCMHRYMVRDCIEGFALSLDKLCFFLLFFADGTVRMKTNQRFHDILSDKDKEYLKKFSRKGISPKDGKIKELQKEFGLVLPEEYKTVIKGLKDVRDCVSHHNSIVREADGERINENECKFTWLTMRVFHVDEITKERELLEFDKLYENAGHVSISIDQNEKVFNIGEPITFSRAEAYEIARSLSYIRDEYFKLAREIMAGR